MEYVEGAPKSNRADASISQGTKTVLELRWLLVKGGTRNKKCAKTIVHAKGETHATIQEFQAQRGQEAGGGVTT